MSNRIRKTEHAGAKNGGGHWGKRQEAKALSKRIRRAQSHQLEYSAMAPSQSFEQVKEMVPSQETATEDEGSSCGSAKGAIRRIARREPARDLMPPSAPVTFS
jgi:hypothetical protein